MLGVNICNFADDNTLYTCDLSLSDLIGKLEPAAPLVIGWFRYNFMKLNVSKCQLLVCGNKEEGIIAKIVQFFRHRNPRCKSTGNLN